MCAMCNVAHISNIYSQPISIFDGRFQSINEQGLRIYYSTLTDSTVMVTSSNVNYNYNNSVDTINYNYITADTIIIPEQVENNGHTYTVVATDPKGAFGHIKSVQVIILPKTIQQIGDTLGYCEYIENSTKAILAAMDKDRNFGFQYMPNLKSINVDAENPHFQTIDGVVYTKDLKNLIVYPSGKTEKSYNVIDGCEHIVREAFFSCTHLEEIDFPNSLKSIGYFAFWDTPLKRLVLKDSVEAIGAAVVNEENYSKGRFPCVVFGANTHLLGYLCLPPTDTIYCRAMTPPAIAYDDEETIVSASSYLFVPRNSIKSYQTAAVWSICSNILPIEPPVVSTEEGVTISWVQSFSATGYVWYLYKDEAHTQLAMSLAFDKDGRLQEITLNSPAPQRVEAEDVEEGNNEAERFAEYFSFTIKNLSANANNYYLRQTFCQGEVIETEEGTFNTTPDTPTAIQGPTPSLPAIEGEDKVTKILQDGTILLLRNGKRYTICGEEHQ